METHILDAFLAPVIVPTIMTVNLCKQVQIDKEDLLYATVTLGTGLGAIISAIQFHVNRTTRSRSHLTILTALILTLTSILSISMFNLARNNLTSQTYQLPLSVRGQAITNNAAVFRYHFFADFIPGFIIFSQIQLCSMIKNDLLCRAKRTFTLGEASIISQLASSAYLTWALVTYSRYTKAGPFQVNLTTNIVLEVGFLTFAIIFVPSYLFLKRKATLIRYALIGFSLLASYLRIWSLISETSNLDPLSWLVDHIFSTHQRISLFSLWLSTLTACVSFSTSWARMVGRTNSLVRKIFHLAISVVFISGYNQDIDFMRFAVGGVFIVMFILEMMRAWQLRPVARQLESVCQALRGKWDNRYLTVSHMYLLIGTYLPLWILPDGIASTNKLTLSCGLISVAVGDTAAAIIGTFLGRTKIREKTGKTVEGLLGNFAAMILFKLIWVGYSGFVEDFTFVIAAIFTSIAEGVTNTCDNLILPLVMIFLIVIL